MICFNTEKTNKHTKSVSADNLFCFSLVGLHRGNNSCSNHWQLIQWQTVVEGPPNGTESTATLLWLLDANIHGGPKTAQHPQCHNSVKSQPIIKILSLEDSLVNLSVYRPMCLSQVGVLSERVDGWSWFSAGRLLSTSPTLKVKFSHTRYRALGPELIPVYRQSARRWHEVNHAIYPAVVCRCFLPDLRLPS